VSANILAAKCYSTKRRLTFAKTLLGQEGDVDRAGAVQEGERPEHGRHAGQRRFGTNLINLFFETSE
jgi:hypothetical protein